MFGSRKIQELEYKLREVTDNLDKITKERNDLTQRLSEADAKIADLEAKVAESELEHLKEDARATQAQFEGLKELYTRKVKEFDDSIEQREEDFAQEDALKRHNLENEIRDNRQANQEYVAGTVKRFSESYNYYLNQIKLLMDALGDIAKHTGEALFTGEYSDRDLMTSMGEEIVARLKTDTDSLRTDDSGLVLIGTPEEAQKEDAPEAPDDEVILEADADTFSFGGEAAAYTDEVTEEAVEEIAEDADGLAEEVASLADEAVEEVAEDVAEAAEEAAGLADEVKESVEDTFGEVSDFADNAFEEVSDFAEEAAEDIADFTAAPAEEISDLAEDAAEKVADFAEEAKEEASGFAADLVEEAADFSEPKKFDEPFCG